MPVYLSFAFGNGARVGSVLLILGLGSQATIQPAGKRLPQKLSTKLSQFGAQGLCRILGLDGNGFLRQNWSGIQTNVHEHDGDPGLFIAAEDGSGNGRSTTMSGQ